MDEQVFPDGDTGGEDVATESEDGVPAGVRPAPAPAPAEQLGAEGVEG